MHSPNRWDLAKAVGVSKDTVQRVWKDEGVSARSF
jgi:DNA-binding XRE family transcriptional regulator